VKVGEPIVFGPLGSSLTVELVNILRRESKRAAHAGGAVALLPLAQLGEQGRLFFWFAVDDEALTLVLELKDFDALRFERLADGS
jgi:hypothetical protein